VLLDTISFDAGAATSTGNRRSVNEDSHAVTERFCLVADGMGGHIAGGVASSIAAEQIALHLAHAPVIDEVVIHRAVEVAHREVLRRAVLDDTEGMGTTVVLAAVACTEDGSPAIAVAHVGDSRCYRFSEGELELVTADHSLVHELVRTGRCTVAEAAAHPMANVITRAVGVEQLAHAEVTLLPAERCRLLLCSDGLSDELPARTIGRVLAGIVDPSTAAARLVELALAGEARDNVTAVVIDAVLT
jgi:serine/threonine protein phosphatase PrpC